EQALKARDARLIQRGERGFLGQRLGEIGFAFGCDLAEADVEGIFRTTAAHRCREHEIAVLDAEFGARAPSARWAGMGTRGLRVDIVGRGFERRGNGGFARPRRDARPALGDVLPLAVAATAAYKM